MNARALPTAALRWGLIGASTIADEWIIGSIREAGGDVVAVYSRSAPRAAQVARRHRIPQADTDLEALLGAQGVDAVFVSSTNQRHRDEVLAAAGAGKHILCEKPLALTVADAREMVQAARDAGVVLAVNHQQREQAAIRQLRRLITDGALGTIRAARFQHAGRLRDDLRTWRLHDPAAGAGVELDLTVHDADLVRFVLGTEVTEVTAMTRIEDEAAAATSAMAVLRLGDDVLVSLHEGFNTRFATPAVEIHGELATALCTGHDAQTAGGEIWLTRAPGGRELVEIEASVAPYVGVIRAFQAAVLDGSPPSASGEDGLRSLQIALAVTVAARAGRRVRIDLTL